MPAPAIPGGADIVPQPPGHIAEFGTNDRAITTVHPEGSQMATASTGPATTAYQEQELAAVPHAAVITPGNPGRGEAPRS